MPSSRIPLANQIESRQPSTSRDSRSVNALFETDGEKTRIVKRPGLKTLACTPALPTGVGQGLTSWYNRIIAIISNTVYTITGGVREVLGGEPVVGTDIPFSFTQTANEDKLVFHNGSNLYVVTKAGMVVTEPISGSAVGEVDITDGGATYNAKTVVTISIASPCVISWTGHGLVAGQGVRFTSTGYVPIGITIGITYAVAAAGLTANSFQLVTTGLAPAVVNTSGSQFGAHSCWPSPTVSFSGGSPSTPASGTALIYNNRVSEVVLSKIGVGYSATPVVTLSAPTTAGTTAVGTCIVTTTDNYVITLDHVNITNGGGFYTEPPTVTFTWSFPYAPPYPPLSPATTPVGYAVLTNGQVSSVVITTKGLAFWSNLNGTAFNTCLVTFSAPTQKTATATAAMTSTITGPYVSGLEYLDGYVFMMGKNSRIYSSAYEDPSTWDGTYIAAASDPDEGVALVRHLNYLIAFGEYSTDFYYNAGNAAGSPLAVNKQAKLELGCANGSSVAKVEQSLFWVSNAKTQGRSVYIMNGLSPQKVSTRYIDKYLNRDSMKDVHSYCLRLAGHTLYVLTLINSDITLVYDLDEKVWYQWTSQSGDIETYFKYLFFTGNVTDLPDLYVQHETDGLVYIMDNDYYDDNGEDIWFRSVSKNMDSGSNKRKFITRTEIIGDKVDGVLQVRHSDNDYQTWSNYRSVNLNKTRPVLYQGGTTRRRAYEVFSSDAIPIRLEAIELDFDIGEQGGGQEV